MTKHTPTTPRLPPFLGAANGLLGLREGLPRHAFRVRRLLRLLALLVSTQQAPETTRPLQRGGVNGQEAATGRPRLQQPLRGLPTHPGFVPSCCCCPRRRVRWQRRSFPAGRLDRRLFGWHHCRRHCRHRSRHCRRPPLRSSAASAARCAHESNAAATPGPQQGRLLGVRWESEPAAVPTAATAARCRGDRDRRVRHSR
jgi:hypothetical protein